MLWRGLAVSLTGLAIFASSAHASEVPVESERLRVVTYNVWGIPIISQEREARLQKIPAAILSLEPDLVTLQEIWLEEDRARLQSALKAGGLRHIRVFGAAEDNGLMVASRHPISDVEYRPFSAGAHPHTPWHLDWIAEKGVARLTIETTSGPVDFVTTHMQATYGTNDYVAVQLSQILETGRFLRRTTQRTRPIVVAGDLNARSSTLPFRLLKGLFRLETTEPKNGVDAILYRSSPGIAVERERVRRALRDPVDLGEGVHMALSDHPAIVADLRLQPVAARPAPIMRTAGFASKEVGEALAFLDRDATVQSDRKVQHTMMAIALLGCAFVLLAFARRQGHLRRYVLMASAVALLIWGGWFGYMAAVYHPGHLDALTKIRGTLIKQSPSKPPHATR